MGTALNTYDVGGSVGYSQANIASAIQTVQGGADNGICLWFTGGTPFTFTTGLDIATVLVASTGVMRPLNFLGNTPGLTDGFDNARSTRWKWTGGGAGTMFKLIGRKVVFENILFDGNAVAGTGIVFAAKEGWGSNQCIFRNCGFTGFDQCVQFGVSSDDNLCSDMQFYNCDFSDSRTGIAIVNDQGVNYDFFGCSFVRVENCFDLQRGGAVRMFGGSVINCDRIFKTGIGGHNIGVNKLSGVRMEKTGKLVAYGSVVSGADSSGGTDYDIDGLSMADGSASGSDTTMSLFTLGANTTVHVRASNLKRPTGHPMGNLIGTGASNRASIWLERTKVTSDGGETDAKAWSHNSYGSVFWDRPIVNGRSIFSVRAGGIP